MWIPVPKGSEIFLKGEKQPDQAGQSGVHCVLKSVEKTEGPEGWFLSHTFILKSHPKKYIIIVFCV